MMQLASRLDLLCFFQVNESFYRQVRRFEECSALAHFHIVYVKYTDHFSRYFTALSYCWRKLTECGGGAQAFSCAT